MWSNPSIVFKYKKEYHLFLSIKKVWTEAIFFLMLYKCITANTVPYGSMLHTPPTNLLLLAAKQEPYRKAYLLTKNIGRFFWKKFRRMDQQAEKKKIRQKA